MNITENECLSERRDGLPPFSTSLLAFASFACPCPFPLPPQLLASPRRSASSPLHSLTASAFLRPAPAPPSLHVLDRSSAPQLVWNCNCEHCTISLNHLFAADRPGGGVWQGSPRSTALPWEACSANSSSLRAAWFHTSHFKAPENGAHVIMVGHFLPPDRGKKLRVFDTMRSFLLAVDFGDPCPGKNGQQNDFATC